MQFNNIDRNYFNQITLINYFLKNLPVEWTQNA